MEDAATTEISRAQVWQWIRHGARLENGRRIDSGVFQEVFREVMEEFKKEVGRERYNAGKYDVAGQLFAAMSMGTGKFSGEIPDFLTLPAYEHLLQEGK